MDTREHILTAALDVYAQHGFRGATTRRIADAAGVNEVTVFRHFGSKESLLAEAVRYVAAEDEVIAPLTDLSQPERELGRWSQAHLAHLRARRSVIRTCMGEVEERPELLQCARTGPRRAFRELCAYLERLRETDAMDATVNIHAAAAMLMGALFADAMARDMDPEMFPTPADAAPRFYVQLLLRAIGGSVDESAGPRRAASPPFVPDATGA